MQSRKEAKNKEVRVAGLESLAVGFCPMAGEAGAAISCHRLETDGNGKEKARVAGLTDLAVGFQPMVGKTRSGGPAAHIQGTTKGYSQSHFVCVELSQQCRLPDLTRHRH